MAEYITHSRAETVALGRRMAAVLAAGSAHCLYGGLGRRQNRVLPGPGRGPWLHRPG